MEHASVASFARASLELLALGAPPELVAATHAAAGDEVRHARLAFSIARAYGAAPSGPGPLDLGGAFAASVAPRAVARALALEGCVGETFGAAEARHAAAGCRDPELAALHAEIADDELTHAALAWRTLAWLFQAFGEEARNGAREGFAEALRSLGTPGPLDEVQGAPEHGVLTGAEVVLLRRAVADLVIAPAASALGTRWPGGQPKPAAAHAARSGADDVTPPEA